VPSPSKLKAIFFDIDDTLFSTSGFARAARMASVKAMIGAGLKMEAEECFQELSEVIEEFGSNFERHYDKVLLRVPRERYAGISPAIIIAAGMVAYHQTKFRELRPYPDVVEVFKLLSQTPLILGIITAGLEIKQAEKLIRLDLTRYIHPRAIFITDQLGIGKQNPKLYQLACQHMGLVPACCMYVGDHPLYDVDIPNKVGLITVHNKRSGKYLKMKGNTDPRYVIKNMWELVDILRREFGMHI